MPYSTRMLVSFLLIFGLVTGSGCAVTRPHQPQTIPDEPGYTPSTYPHRSHAGPKPWFWVLAIILGIAIVDD